LRLRRPDAVLTRVSDVLDDLQDLKARAEDAKRRRAKREADIDNLQSRLRDDLSRLREFELDLEEPPEGADYAPKEVIGAAKTKLSEMESSLSTDVKKLRQLLEAE